MRILFLDQTGQLGGAELFLADVAERYAAGSVVTLFEDGPLRALLEERGVRVSVLSAGKQSPAVTKASGFQSVFAAGGHFLKLAFQVARQARDFDLIYTNTAKALVVGSVAAFLARRLFLHHLHDIISADHFSGLNRRLLVTFGNRARAVVSNSEATRSSFIASGGRLERSYVVYNGFDVETCDTTTVSDRPRLRDELGIGGGPCVLMVGRLTPWKGQHVFLEALRALPGVHAVIAGEALFTSEDRTYADEIRLRASEGELKGRVHFIGFRDDLPAWYQMADMVVHASIAPEPFGRVIVEGMLAGKPVVATRGGGPSEIITHGETGYLVQADDVGELSNAIGSILADPQAASAMAARGRAYARQKFSKKAVLEALDQIISAQFAPRHGVCPAV